MHDLGWNILNLWINVGHDLISDQCYLRRSKKATIVTLSLCYTERLKDESGQMHSDCPGLRHNFIPVEVQSAYGANYYRFY